MKRAYLSWSLKRTDRDVKMVEKYLEDLGYEVSRHRRGDTYSSSHANSLIIDADIFVILPNYNCIEYGPEMLTRGCYSELMTRLHHTKDFAYNKVFSAFFDAINRLHVGEYYGSTVYQFKPPSKADVSDVISSYSIF